MLKKIKPLYEKHYTQNELEELIVFFKSPIGKKYINSSQKIGLESMQFSQELSMKMVKEMTSKINAKSNLNKGK